MPFRHIVGNGNKRARTDGWSGARRPLCRFDRLDGLRFTATWESWAKP